MTYYHKRSGVSLLIALVLTGLLVLFGLFTSSIVLSSVRQSTETTRSNQAFYAAEGALEMGLLENSLHGAGYSSPVKNIDMFLKVCGANLTPECIAQMAPASGTVQIEGQVAATAKFTGTTPEWYGIPTPGTGTAGKNCDPLQASTSAPFEYPEGSNLTYEPEDHPCNWNILKVGEVATIPLYTYNANGDIVNLLTSNSQLKLKIRTPCKNGEYVCPAGLTRFGWDLNNGDPQYDGNDPIVTWQIVGTDSTGVQSYRLGPYIYLDGNTINPLSTIITEIKIGSVNTAALDYKVLDHNSLGTDDNNCTGKMINFLTNNFTGVFGCDAGTPSWNTQTMTKPVLTFTIVQTMKSDQNETIPSLEYQILADTSLAPINATQIITAEGFAGSFKQTLQVKQPKSSSLPEYVIQQ